MGVGLPLFVAFFLMPILFAVAVLRYRLYDLEVIINRTFVVAAGTAFAAVGYITLVVLVGPAGRGPDRRLLAVAARRPRWSPWPSSRCAGWWSGWPNRAAYGSRAQPYEALADFSSRLAEAPDPDDLLPAVAEAAARAVSGARGTATLDIPGGAPVSGTWGWWAADQEVAGPRGPGPDRGARAGPHRGGAAARPQRCGPRTCASSRRWPTRRRWRSATPRWPARSPTGSPSSTAPPGSWPTRGCG